MCSNPENDAALVYVSQFLKIWTFHIFGIATLIAKII